MTWWFDPSQIVSGDANAAWRVRGPWTIKAQAEAIKVQVGRVFTQDPVAHARDAVVAKLQAYVGGGSADDQDALFQEHTWLVEKALNGDGIHPSTAVNLWHDDLAAAVTVAETRLGEPIHKGAPFYNCALCLLRNQQFDSAFSYFSEGASEDTRTRGTQALRLLVGDHPLSARVMIDPLVPFVGSAWGGDYQAIAGATLAAPELTALLVWMAQRAEDAIQMLVALHSWMALQGTPVNDASNLARVEALRRMHIALESSLRHHNIGAGELHSRMDALVSPYPDAKTAFDTEHNWFVGQFPTPAQRATTIALNQILGRVPGRFVAAPTRRAHAGIASYAAVKVRNGTLHQNDNQTVLFTNPGLALRLGGWALATARSIKHDRDGTF